MGVTDDPIEIKVVADQASGEVAVDDPADAESRRVPLSLVLIAGVVALIVGVVAGRLSLPDDGVDDATSPGSATVATTEVTSGDRELDTVPDAAVAPNETTAPPVDSAVATTTSVATVRVDPRVLGTDLRLVGLGNGELYDLDLATGAFDVTAVDALQATSSMPQVFRQMVVGDDWVMVTGDDDGEFDVVHADGSVDDLPILQVIAYTPGTDRLWTVGGIPGQLDEVHLDGTRTGASIEVTEPHLVTGDPAGGVIVPRGGRSFRVDGEIIEALPEGEVIAVSADVVVVERCDGRLACSIWSVDRPTGDERRVPVDSSMVVAPPSYGPFVSSGAGRVGPTGRHAVVSTLAYSGHDTMLLDLDTGELTSLPIGADAWNANLVWSPDGELVFVGNGTRVFAVDVWTGDAFPLLAESNGIWYRFAERPSAN